MRVLTILILLFAGAAAHAQPQADSAMLGVCSGLLQQGAGTVSGNKQVLCECLVRETTTRLTVDEMSAYSEAALNNRAPPPAVMAKVMSIATGCLNAAK